MTIATQYKLVRRYHVGDGASADHMRRVLTFAETNYPGGQVEIKATTDDEGNPKLVVEIYKD